MLNDWERLTFFPLKWISLGGLHPKTGGFFVKILFWYNFGCFGTILGLAITQICLSYENIYYTIDSILTIVLYLHIISKYVSLRLHRDTLATLIQLQSRFWKIDTFDLTIRQKCVKILTKSLTIIKSYLGYSLVVVTSFLIRPIITGELPVSMYVPRGTYYIFFVLFMTFTPGIMSSIWGVDTLFYSIATPVSIQFKLLAHKFETIDLKKNSKQVRQEFQKLVNYHNFLINYCQIINKMSSEIFLTQYLVAIATSCLQLFITSQPEFDFLNKIKCLSYFIMQIIETGIYCFTAQLISDSAENVGNAVYKSAWYDCNPSTRKNIALVLVRSQKKFAFNGLGLVWIKMETFTKIFKTALSFYTYLNTMVYQN
ncbi:odorant receptor 4-like [Tribolium madens]|uniref:odorant receptor 4-like n=1 Tax=Tribolium madens TaxID=41895 RepID=UPI001CF75CA3|nr:odorant receptor 4-like [Tribolium madens]